MSLWGITKNGPQHKMLSQAVKIAGEMKVKELAYIIKQLQSGAPEDLRAQIKDMDILTLSARALIEWQTMKERS